MARTAKLKKLTEKQVKAYLNDTRKTTPLHDGGGLYLRKRATGCFWYLRLTDPDSGADQWHRMFPDDPQAGYPLKTLADARAEADKLWRVRSDGVDPRAARLKRIADEAQRKQQEAEQRRRRITVRDLFDQWALVQLAPHVTADGERRGRKDGGDYLRQLFDRRVFPAIGNVAADDVRKVDVVKILDRARADGTLRTANVLLSSMRQLFRFAQKREIVSANPTDLLTAKDDAGGKNVERERTLSDDEIKQLAAALPHADLGVRATAAVWLILSTGVRLGEALNAQWQDVDFNAGTWHLRQTKNQRDHLIHLSDFATGQMEWLALHCELGEDGAPLPWLFPNATGSGPTSVATFGKQLADRQRPEERQLKARTSKTDVLMLPGGRWTAHDLRRTAGTLMGRLGISGDVIDECLNHKISSTVRRIYVRTRRLEEQARAFDALGQRLQALSGGAAEPSNVVALDAVRAA